MQYFNSEKKKIKKISRIFREKKISRSFFKIKL